MLSYPFPVGENLARSQSSLRSSIFDLDLNERISARLLPASLANYFAEYWLANRKSASKAILGDLWDLLACNPSLCGLERFHSGLWDKVQDRSLCIGTRPIRHYDGTSLSSNVTTAQSPPSPPINNASTISPLPIIPFLAGKQSRPFACLRLVTFELR